jgi:aryl-phospho-beta-D-glucosidase BglC (GH1 family)
LNLTVVTGSNFTLAAAPVTINQGASGSSAITITRTGFTGTVNLAASGQPANVTVTVTPASTNGNSATANVTVGATVAAGTYPITITGTAAGISGPRTATLNLTVAVGPNFTLSASPASLTITAGSSGTTTITAARTGGFTGAVTLSGPASVTFNPNPIPAAPATTSTATISVAAGTPAGTSNVTISGTAGGIAGARNVTVSVTVTPPTTSAVFRVDPTGRITKNNQPFPVRCGSWFGLEGRHEPSNDPTNPSGAPMELYIGNTFWANGGQGTGRTIQQTMTEIVNAGINVVRLPVVPQTLDPNNPQGRDPNLKNHSSVRVANSRLALEQFIRLADQNNIEVMLDVHSCSNYVGWRKGRLDARPPYVDADRDNYDFTRETYSCSATGNPSTVTTIHPYNQTAWLNDLRTLAGLGQQLGVDNIIGIDIFNEPWDYTWQEWKTLTEAAYQAINAVNPNILLFVQGISASAGNQDGSPNTIIQVPHGDEDTNPNWGENLFEAGSNPITVPQSRIVFSPHTYGPSVFVQKMFMDPTQPECVGLEGDQAGDQNCRIVINPTLLRQGWEEHFGYLRDLGYAVVVGEFGGNLDWPLGQASIRDRNRWNHITPGVDGQWQNAFVDYMLDRDIEGCYWSINPESGDTAGWYGHAYDPISNTAGWGQWLDFDDRKTDLLNRLWNR